MAPLPIRLGGDELEGWTATQHARFAADLLAARRTAPLMVLQITAAGGDTILNNYVTQQPNTVPAPVVEDDSQPFGWNALITIPGTASLDDTDDGRVMCVLRAATITSNTDVFQEELYAEATGNQLRVGCGERIGDGETITTGTYTIVVYGEMRLVRTSIGDYGGSLNKRDDETENPVPYAAHIYRDLQEQRGSAYSKKTGTLVHAENLAIARQAASVYYRLPDKLRNNASGPAHADEGLDYWVRCLGISTRPEETRESIRTRATIHRRLPDGSGYNSLVRDCSALLGDAFVGITLNHDGDLESPPVNTYWPTINPGPTSFDIGGGTWLSERSQIIVNVQQPGGMSEGEFKQLVNVDLFQLLDRMIPAWGTAQWRNDDTARIVWDGDGILWDGDGIVWSNLYDWNS